LGRPKINNNNKLNKLIIIMRKIKIKMKGKEMIKILNE
jgi:hypothetical protein